MIEILEPTIARLPPGAESNKALRGSLEYIDTKVDFDLRRFKKQAYWFSQQNGEEAYQEKVEEMKAQRKKSLLFQDSAGSYTYSGLAGRAASILRDEVEVKLSYPEPKNVPWLKAPENEVWEHQQKAHDRLLAVKHGAVEIGTGLGKSRIIEMLVKSLGLKTIVMAPSVSIAEQLLAEMGRHFGSRYVGQFFDGKKRSDRLITIAVSASLARVVEGSKDWENLSAVKVFIADESHMCPAQTLAKVCFGLAAAAPYRFFFSGTQMRNDGSGVLLDGITGPVVYRMTVRQGVDEGFLALPRFRMISVESALNYSSDDAGRMSRKHLFYNTKVNKVAADLANRFVEKLRRPTLILIEEVEQFAYLYPHLRGTVAFAHGPLQKAGSVKGKAVAGNACKVPDAFQESDPTKLVEDFNAGKIQTLVGTSCIATGTDLRANEATIYLMGGKSEIQVKQAVGRDTRGGAQRQILNPWTKEKKMDCFHIDFDIANVDMLHRHANERREIYEDVYGPVEEMDLR